jgi:anti-sigma-K factor RskA
MSVHEQYADNLTLYALGVLEGSELADLQTHLTQCATCRRELQELRGDMGLLALATMGPEPSASVRARLLSALTREPRVLMVRKKSPNWWLLVPMAAAVVLSAIISVVLWRQNSTLRQDLAQQLKQSGQNRSEAERASEVLALLRAPDAIQVTLVAPEAKSQPQGKAIYRSQTGSLAFLASNFGPLPPKKAYELWLLPTSGAPPVPVGVFKPDARGSATLLMPRLPKDLQAKAFAITIEPESGSSIPTMPIMLAGAA